MTEPKQSFTEEIQKEATERYKPFYNQSSYDENALRRTTFIEGANVALSILSRKNEGREFYLLPNELGDMILSGVFGKERREAFNSSYGPAEVSDRFIEHSALVAEKAKNALLQSELDELKKKVGL